MLEQVGLITRTRSSGDGRRRYVHLHRDALDGLIPGRPGRAGRGAVRVHPQLGPVAAGRRAVDAAHRPAGRRRRHPPGRRVHPGAVAAGRRAGLDLTDAQPQRSTTSTIVPALVVTVCDRAHEELDPDPAWLHWSVPDPVAAPSRAAFDATVAELRSRITASSSAAP